VEVVTDKEYNRERLEKIKSSINLKIRSLMRIKEKRTLKLRCKMDLKGILFLEKIVFARYSTHG
jgi:hypothetical protein